MSGLIKSGTAHSVRPFLGAETLVPRDDDPRIAALERENEELRAALAAQRLAGEQSVASARAEGERQGRAAAGDAIDQQVAILGKGVEAALEAWQKRLVDLDLLAPSLARAALGKLFDDGEEHARFVAGLIARQMRRLRRESLIAIRVSARDFADEAALAELGATAGAGSVRILADADLESGGCRIDLQLGHIDLGAATQWTQLAEFLDGLAAGDGAE